MSHPKLPNYLFPLLFPPATINTFSKSVSLLHMALFKKNLNLSLYSLRSSFPFPCMAIFIKIKMMWVGSRAAGGSSLGFSFSHSQASLLQSSPEPRVGWGTSPAEPLASLGLGLLVVPGITWQDSMQAGCCSYILEWVKPSSLELQSISLPRPNDRSIPAFVLYRCFNNR